MLWTFKTEQIQTCSINITDWQGPLTVTSVYCPPKHIITEDMFNEFFNTLGHRFIAGGDWNAKNIYWGSRITVTRGRELKNSIDVGGLGYLSSGEPTYWPTDIHKTPDLLHFFITKGISKIYTKIESCYDGSSDHSPIIASLSTTVIQRE